MKKIIFVMFVLCFSLFSLSAEKVYNLDQAIQTVAKELSSKLPAGTKVVIVNIKAAKPEAGEYIADQLTYELLQAGKLVVVDRQNLGAIRTELSLQTSGDVSDESAQKLGALLGAETLVSGSFEQLSDKYRLTTKAVKVETSEIQYLSAKQVFSNSQTDAVFGKKTGTAATVSAVGSAVWSVADFTGRLICSSINPAFGIGSFIQGDSSGGSTVVFWEVAGTGLAVWGGYDINAGKKDGQLLVAAGGICFTGAIIYSWIRPWTYNRAPKVAEALDNVQISYTGDNTLSAGYTVRY
jgi:hypothetical protein